MTEQRLILVLGDQLTPARGALGDLDPSRDTVVMAEVAAEASYVRHNRHKIALIFSAMRHFCAELRSTGVSVIYYGYTRGLPSLTAALDSAVMETGATSAACCEPGEYRVKQLLENWAQDSDINWEWYTDNHFLCSPANFADWAQGRKQLRMEYFYREMRKRYHILLDSDGKPEGGNWNYDKENRAGWRSKHKPPLRPVIKQDPVTLDVLALVSEAFPDNPGDLAQFNLAVDTAGAEAQLDFFIASCLPLFGTYQDAMAEESPWLYHSLVSMYLNIGLLDPLDTCRKVEAAWRRGECSLAAAEGFIRQVLGWREYVRGVYWLAMPGYAQRNHLQATTPLPAWFWDAKVDMRCLQQALAQSLELGYGHHIQRLMIIGNFALLAGLDVQEVCDWYLAVYVDAFEWVELPNTLGMALHGDGGLMASKPYAASGKYIQRQGDHCKQCRYTPARVTGEGACPYNSLYWDFLNRHGEEFSNNPRMGLALKNWYRKETGEQTAILQWADAEKKRLLT